MTAGRATMLRLLADRLLRRGFLSATLQKTSLSLSRSVILDSSLPSSTGQSAFTISHHQWRIGEPYAMSTLTPDTSSTTSSPHTATTMPSKMMTT